LAVGREEGGVDRRLAVAPEEGGGVSLGHEPWTKAADHEHQVALLGCQRHLVPINDPEPTLPVDEHVPRVKVAVTEHPWRRGAFELSAQRVRALEERLDHWASRLHESGERSFGGVAG